jgi:hypothetical protein
VPKLSLVPGNWRIDRGRPADEGACPVEEPERRKAVRLVHVTGSLPQQAGIVFVETKAAIAVAAKEAADVAAVMA